MEFFIIIFGILLICFASGHIPIGKKYEMSPKVILYLVLVLIIFSITCLHYSFRRRAQKYGYASIGGIRGFL